MHTTDTSTCEKKLICAKRELYLYGVRHSVSHLYISKETYVSQKRPKYLKRNLYMKIENCIFMASVTASVTCMYLKRPMHQKKLTRLKRDIYISKETYTSQKRHIHLKRDIYISKEKCTSEKRHIHLKRDTYISKEIYTSEKRNIQYTSEKTRTSKRAQSQFIFRLTDLKRDLYT